MTSKAIFYYSNFGNTKAIVEESNTNGYDIFNLKYIDTNDLTFNNYDVILIGTPTLGDGIPPVYFQKIQRQLMSIDNKQIGLFGSGNSIYKHYCGALDLLEGLLSVKNTILFNFKFESYPTSKAKEDFQELLNKYKEM